MDIVSTLQQQINNQLSSITATLSSSSLPAAIKTDLTSSAGTLQGLLDKILLGQTLTTADQAALTSSLDTSQKAILAAKAQQTQTLIFVLSGIAVVAVTLFLIIRQHKKRKAT